VDAIVLELPGPGRWLVQNSPARRVPSHGTELYGSRYAIDLVGVDERGRSAPASARALVAAEPPERFAGFGRPVLAPVAGEVVAAHDGEPDRGARRSPLTLLPYALTQAGRVRAGVAAIAGNHVVIALPDGACVAVVHLRRGSIRVVPGQRVDLGSPIAACGNSGNSTEPHVHLQAADRPEMRAARGLPIVFRRFRQQLRRGGWVERGLALPGEGSIIQTA
jgi:murein DD-endopeptidase MepM/ murein hydrolase activator NlpD